MSDHIPFEIQSEIIKRLPVKSLVQFRSVSKQWKSFIDSPEFINNYHINHTNPQHHLFVSYELDAVQTYTSIIDNNTFPQHKFPLTAPQSLSLLRDTFTLSSDDGLLCFCGYYGDLDSGTRRTGTRRAVIWNPTVRRSVGIDVNPNEMYQCTFVGFGVCHGDPKLVKISVIEDFHGRPSMWAVDVFSLSTRDWRNVHRDMQPFRLCILECAKVCINGVIYFRAYDLENPSPNFFISFNLESGAFGEVPFPGDLVRAVPVQAAKVNESLGILHYHHGVCEVWTKEEGANVTFDMKYTVEVMGQRLYYSVLGFRNNGEVVLEDDNFEESRIEVYDPSSGGHITIGDIGIYGTRHKNSARSYMETAYLIDQPEPDIIIH